MSESKTFAQLADAARALGFDPAHVRAIHIDMEKVTVELIFPVVKEDKQDD